MLEETSWIDEVNFRTWVSTSQVSPRRKAPPKIIELSDDDDEVASNTPRTPHPPASRNHRPPQKLRRTGGVVLPLPASRLTPTPTQRLLRTSPGYQSSPIVITSDSDDNVDQRHLTTPQAPTIKLRRPTLKTGRIRVKDEGTPTKPAKSKKGKEKAFTDSESEDSASVSKIKITTHIRVDSIVHLGDAPRSGIFLKTEGL